MGERGVKGVIKPPPRKKKKIASKKDWGKCQPRGKGTRNPRVSGGGVITSVFGAEEGRI